VHGFCGNQMGLFQVIYKYRALRDGGHPFFCLYVWGTSSPRLVGLGPQTDEFGELESFTVEASRLKLPG
jgi:hypothetical protein